MDVDPLPPDDDLGWAELDVLERVPSPGDTWEQWLPLKGGPAGEAEVFVRLAHLAPAAVQQGALPLVLQAPAVASGSSGTAVGAAPGGSEADVDGVSASGLSDQLPAMQQVLLGTLTDQVGMNWSCCVFMCNIGCVRSDER